MLLLFSFLYSFIFTDISFLIIIAAIVNFSVCIYVVLFSVFVFVFYLNNYFLIIFLHIVTEISLFKNCEIFLSHKDLFISIKVSCSWVLPAKSLFRASISVHLIFEAISFFLDELQDKNCDLNWIIRAEKDKQASFM